ncbi:hypothetical protein G6F68_009920 [Rhizopus microsporus]|nr:hypothetical protein G6F68_009920 [Rhizopus microsporus]
MSQASRKAAMSSALGQPLPSSWSRASSVMTSQAKALRGIAPLRVSALQDEWFGVGLQLLTVKAQTMPTPGSGELAPSITRLTRVAIGAGHAYGDADAQRRIGNAPTAWRQAETASLAQARRVGVLAQRMDGPWGRSAVSMDWLSAWADLVPSDRLGKRARRLMLAGGLVANATALAPAMALATDGIGTKPAAASLSRLRFPEGSRHAVLAERLWLYGQAAQVVVFDVPMKAPDLVRVLSGQQSALADMNVLPGHLILSGQIGDEQWGAQMADAGPGRTVGSISSLRLRASPASPAPAWLPEGARLRLDVAVMDKNVRVSERIWQHAMTPTRMMSVLDTGLLREGWQRLRGDGDAQSWARGGGHREGPAYPWHAAVAPCGRLWAGVGGWPGVGVGGARARAAAGSGPGGASAHARRRTPGRSL